MKTRISKIGIIILLIVAICVAFFYLYTYLKTQTDDDIDIDDIDIKRELIVEPSELNISMGTSIELKAYLYNSNSNEKEDVTDQAEWTTNDSSIVVVGNKSIKGQITSRVTEGTTKIIASYDDQQIEVAVIVYQPELSVECLPRIMNNGKAEFRDTAKIGEIIHWVSNYPKLGVPHYTYEWSGTDGLEDDQAFAEIIYNTVGLKTAKIFTVDMAGVTAEGECSIIIIE